MIHQYGGRHYVYWVDLNFDRQKQNATIRKSTIVSAVTMAVSASPRNVKELLDSLEGVSRPPFYYSIGEDGRPEDMMTTENGEDDIIYSIARLQPGDHCFVLRSGGRWTFAEVLSRSRGNGQDKGPSLELMVSKKGSKKTILMKTCGKYVRPLSDKALMAQTGQEIGEQKQRPTDTAQVNETEEFTPSKISPRGQQQKTETTQAKEDGEFTPSRVIPKGHRRSSLERMARQAGLSTSLHTGLDRVGGGLSSARNRRRVGNNLHMSFQSGLNGPIQKRGIARRTSHRSSHQFGMLARVEVLESLQETS